MATIGVFLNVIDSNSDNLKLNLDNLRSFDKVYLCLNNLKNELPFTVTEYKNITLVREIEDTSLDNVYKNLLNICDTDYFGMLDPQSFTHGLIYPKLKHEANKKKYRIIYTDEGYIHDDGNVEFYYKGDFDLELLYCQNYINRFAIYHTEYVKLHTVFHRDLNENSDWALALDLTAGLHPSAIKHIPESLIAIKKIKSNNSLPYFVGTEMDKFIPVIKEAVSKTNRSVDVKLNDSGYFDTFYEEHFYTNDLPLVSIVIPTKDNLELLKSCIGSIRENTNYDNYEIVIIDNNSTNKETLDYLESIHSKMATVYRYPFEFNFADMYNSVSKLLKSEYICLLNNDIEIISPNWLGEMVGIAIDPTVGAVGAQLLYEDNTIQHAGVLVGVCGLANHAYSKLPVTSQGYWGKLHLVQNYYAVTGACLLVRLEYYKAIGGMDKNLPVAYNDVDLCIRLKESNLRNVYTPHAKLYHYESKSRGNDLSDNEKTYRLSRDHIYMRYKHGPNLHNDPYYNENLGIDNVYYQAGRSSPYRKKYNTSEYLVNTPSGIEEVGPGWLPLPTKSPITCRVKIPQNTKGPIESTLKAIILPYHQYLRPDVKPTSSIRLNIKFSDNDIINTIEGVSSNENGIRFDLTKLNKTLDKCESMDCTITVLNMSGYIHLKTYYADGDYCMKFDSIKHKQFTLTLVFEND